MAPPHPPKLDSSHPAEAAEVGEQVQHLQILKPLCVLLVIFHSDWERSCVLTQLFKKCEYSMHENNVLNIWLLDYTDRARL